MIFGTRADRALIGVFKSGLLRIGEDATVRGGMAILARMSSDLGRG